MADNREPLPWQNAESGSGGLELELGPIHFWSVLVGSDHDLYALHSGQTIGKEVGAFSRDELDQGVQSYLREQCALLH